MKLVHIDSSILGDASASRQLSLEVANAWRASQPNVSVSYRDLASDAIGQLSGFTLGANGTPAELRNATQAHEAALSDNVLNEFLAADAIIIGAPMYNFSIPSQLKAWIDRVTVAGKTFRYGANGPEGLAGGKKVVIVSTAGGMHAGQPTAAAHDDYLKFVLGFVGITDITVIHAHGLSMGPEAREAAFTQARKQIDVLFETVGA
ncbi:FMN-dependent NADH-azoreductase [Chitinimonas sp. BJB300]|uniref:FMN-dependent NADH-azoreductase n=1 Tax=Chitinimonas sp. BJB300 TaxID=1559339 RepID=UPI000C0E415F|nr:FMN-dependent NADH-azoreductase [Chitinimonas sp. BJB300]PHV09671.1 FMN-dependent NADH-azoreductase [Chitinimonas sp. BJB300]TSJ87365.1 FMN-dependent NADH-azoreductase [Chitinimonas sp. BJB300]